MLPGQGLLKDYNETCHHLFTLTLLQTCMNVFFCGMQKKIIWKIYLFIQWKSMHSCMFRKRKSYRFGPTWGWVNADRIFDIYSFIEHIIYFQFQILRAAQSTMESVMLKARYTCVWPQRALNRSPCRWGCHLFNVCWVMCVFVLSPSCFLSWL